MATGGVAPNPDPNSGVGYYVYLYGDYQHDGHAGMDIACPVGTQIYAIKAGTVVWAGWDIYLPGGPNDWASRWFFYQKFGGRITLIQHGPSEFTAYAHQSRIDVSVGQYVDEGAKIGLSGDSSGGADGQLAPHLHVEHLVDLSYSTGGGLIYGRDNPEPYFGSNTPAPAPAYTTDEQFFIDLDLPLP